MVRQRRRSSNTARTRPCAGIGSVASSTILRSTGCLAKRRVGDVEAAKSFAIQNRIDILYCALPGTRRAEITELMEFCERNTIRFRVIPSAESFIPVVKTSELEFHGAVPVSKIRKEPLDSSFARGAKRAFDVVFSLGVILFIFTWLFPIPGLLVKLSSRGPVFFKQMRLGKDNKEFVCWKFRSMRMNVEADSKQATKNDPRVTTVWADSCARATWTRCPSSSMSFSGT
jgi:putative colanic acid biosynthesis UDP-glucose lipid carrier transferase